MKPTPIYCEVCGNQIPAQHAVISYYDGEDKFIITCPQCYGYLNACMTCEKGAECKFENDPSPVPKLIQKQTRQGQSIFVTTVRNPERVEITCKKGCPCYSDLVGCLREECSTCANWKINPSIIHKELNTNVG